MISNERGQRSLQWVLSVVFCLVLAGPLVAFAAGVRPTLPDNRAAVEVPEAGDLVGLDVAAWEQAQQAFRDRLPGLDWAVQRDAQIDLRLTGRSPNNRVLLGQDGWLFLAETVRRPCMNAEDRQGIVAYVQRLREAAVAADVRLVVVLAPDKAAIRPDRLTEADAARSCAARDIEALAVDLAAPDVIVPLDLLRGEVTAGRPTYLTTDTHWDASTASLVVDELVRHLGSTDEPRTIVQPGSRGMVGDLAVIMGLPANEPQNCWQTVRDGVTLVGQRENCAWSPQVPIRLDATSTGPPLLPSMVFQLDSFGLPMLDVIGPWFQRVTAFYKDNGTDEEMREAIAGADTLVVEIVQRTLQDDLVAREIDRLVAALQARARS